MRHPTNIFRLSAVLASVLLPLAAAGRQAPEQGQARHFDRVTNQGSYVLKGEFLLGATASYGTFTAEDADMFPIFENIGLNGNLATVNPFFGYFYKDNRCVGVRLGYTHLDGGLDNIGLDLGMDGLDLAVPQVALSTDRYSAGIFHRSYMPLDDKGCFGVFGEFDAMFAFGDNVFGFTAGDTRRRTLSDNMNLNLTFSPGVAVYALPNVCMTLSFGLGGFKYNYVRQYDAEGNKSGERHFSKLNFKLNIADIRLGVNIHLWKKASANGKQTAKQAQ